MMEVISYDIAGVNRIRIAHPVMKRPRASSRRGRIISTVQGELTPDEFNSLVCVADIEGAPVKRFYQRILDENAKSLLLEFLVFGLGLVGNYNADGQHSRIIDNRIFTNPDPGLVGCSFRGLCRFQDGCCFFGYCEHRQNSFISPMIKLQAPRLTTGLRAPK